MTSAERQAKARAMEKGAAGLMEHADELRRYDQELVNISAGTGNHPTTLPESTDSEAAGAGRSEVGV